MVNTGKLRNLIYLLLLAGLVALVFYLFYLDFEEPTGEDYDTLIAIPGSAAVILETSDAADLWRDLSRNNLLWSQLMATDYFFRLNELGTTLDSLIRSDHKLRSFLSGKSVSVSIHASGAKDFDYLFSLQVESEVKSNELRETIKSLFRVGEFKSRTYGGESIISFKSPFPEDEFHYYLCDKSLVFSASDILLEESIRSVKQGASILENSRFNRVRETADQRTRGQVYLQYKQFKSILSEYVGDEGRASGFFRQPYADWSALDISLENDAVYLNGFVLAPDSSDSWLAAFSENEAPAPELVDYLPLNTAYFLYMGYGDYQTYRADHLMRLEKANRLYGLEKQRDNYDQECGCDAEELATSWILDQALTFISEPASKSYERNHFALFRTEDVQEAMEKLRLWASRISDSVNEEGDGSDSFKLPVGSFYGSVVSDAFSGLKDPYVGSIGDEIIVMANSENALRTYLTSIEAGRGFTQSAEYEKLRNNLFPDAHLILYSSLARSPFLYENLLAPEYSEIINEKAELVRDFGSFVYQVGYSGNDLFYNGISIRQSETYEPETGAIWEVPLKAEVVGKPHLVKNHYTGALETMIQDRDQRLYLISSNGKILWSRILDGFITGDIHQVDVYKNKKLQLLLSTDKAIYLIDRNGNDVESFPISLKNEATAPVSVADYDNSRDYRFFIPVKGGDILCFDNTGKAVAGWEFDSEGSDLILPVQHLRIKRKDFLFTIQKDGKIRLLNRRGKTRHSVDREVERFFKGSYKVLIGDNIAESALYYADSLGTIYRLQFDGGLEKINPGERVIQDYLVNDLDADGSMDFVLLYSKGMSAYGFSGDVIFESESFDFSNAGLAYHEIAEGPRISITDRLNGKIYLFDPKGQETSGIPLFGNFTPAIGDINLNGYPDLVTAAESGFVYAYSVK